MITLNSAEETTLFANNLGRSLKPGSVIALFGELGTGKTTFLKGLIPAINGISPDEVSSPTFTYLHIYPGPVYHFDLYRLKSAEEFCALGFDEYFETGGIVCFEWAEKIASILPEKALRIILKHAGGDERTLDL